MSLPAFVLNNDVAIPALGLGVYQTAPEETVAAVAAALETGYRHVDTVHAFEMSVGKLGADVR